jgi:hypothetical protein
MYQDEETQTLTTITCQENHTNSLMEIAFMLWICRVENGGLKTSQYATVGRSTNHILNPFQSKFSANHILPSYLFIPAIFLQAQAREYNTQSPVHIKTHGLPRNRKSTTCTICWPKSVLHEEKHRRGADSGAGATKTCRTSSDIGAEQENHNVGRVLTQDRKGLNTNFLTKCFTQLWLFYNIHWWNLAL